MVCKKCGAMVDETAKVCPLCGAEVEPDNAGEAQPQQNVVAQNAASNDKLMGILSYCSILVLIPIIVGNQPQKNKLHMNQGLNLFIIEAALGIIGAIVGLLLPNLSIFRILEKMIGAVIWVCQIACLAFSIWGIVNVVNNNDKELPVIGMVKLIK